MGRDKPPPPSKADKKKKGKGKEPVQKLRKAEKTVRVRHPAGTPHQKDGRPDHGLGGTATSRKWVNKGSRDQRIAIQAHGQGAQGSERTCCEDARKITVPDAG